MTLHTFDDGVLALEQLLALLVVSDEATTGVDCLRGTADVTLAVQL